MPPPSFGLAIIVGALQLAWICHACACGEANANDWGDSIEWRSDYRAATEEARDRQTLLFIWFADPVRRQENELLERALFRPCEVAAHLACCVAAKLPLDAVATLPAANTETPAVESASAIAKPLRLLQHPAFEELHGQEGLAVVDLRDPTSPYFHHVVSIYPFAEGPLSVPQLVAMFELPEGSLTQRTLIWAVRTHAEAPQSTLDAPSPILFSEAASHASHQARIALQGHHQWSERFDRINATFPPHLVAQEVCAESWPGQRLVAAARECVHSWRQSSGHWEAVRTRHPLFGYDMQRGANGTWYATGLFGRRR